MLKRVFVFSLSLLGFGFAGQSMALADGLNSVMRFNPRMAESFGVQVPPPPQNFYQGSGRYYIPHLPHYSVGPHRRYHRPRRHRFGRHRFGTDRHFGR